MNWVSKILIVLLLALPACSGVDSVTKKRWSNSENTISIVDMTSRDFRLMDAGSRLQGAIEENLETTGYILAGKNARYHLKYKVLEFDEGNRMARIATMGMSDSAKAQLRVKGNFPRRIRRRVNQPPLLHHSLGEADGKPLIHV